MKLIYVEYMNKNSFNLLNIHIQIYHSDFSDKQKANNLKTNYSMLI